MSCQVCKIQLGEGDEHFACIIHRKCTRKAPCSFDADEPPEYWDEVEAVLEAVKCASPERKSTRVAAQGGKAKTGRKSGGNEPPPLCPISDKKGKKGGKCKKGDGQKRADTNSYESDHGTSFQGRDPTGEEGQSERRKSKSAEPSTASERMSDQSSGVRYARNKVPNKPSKNRER